MATPQIKIGVGIDGVGFNRGINSMIGQVNHLKSALLTGLGIGAIGEMISSAIEFAKELERSAEELGVNLGRAKQLNHVMEMVGKNSHVWVLAMGKAQDYMEKAYEDAGKMSKLEQLGITPDAQTGEFNFNFDKVLTQALRGSQGMGATERRMLFDDIFGKKIGADIIYKEKDILASPESAGVRDDEIRQIVELNAQFKELKEEISTLIIKALVPFGQWFLGIMDMLHLGGGKSASGYYSKEADYLSNSVSGELSNRGMKQAGMLRQFGADAEVQGKLTGIVTGTPAEKEKFYKDALSSYVMSLAGGDATVHAAVMKDWEANRSTSPLEELMVSGKEKSDTKEAGSPLGRPSGKATKIDSNEFIKVGGLLGVDTTYRLTLDLLSEAKIQTSLQQRIVELMNPSNQSVAQSDTPFLEVSTLSSAPVGSRVNRGGQKY